MDYYTSEAIRAIETQQARVKECSPQWMVGEQLKDICRHEQASAELICQDLQAESMSITEAEKKIKAYADTHKTGNFACVTPTQADRILREFYGLPAVGGEQGADTDAEKTEQIPGKLLNLLDFL